MVLERIDALLGGAPPVPELERTLTDGYATALALEGERLRIERRMDGVAAAIDTNPQGARSFPRSPSGGRGSTASSATCAPVSGCSSSARANCVRSFRSRASRNS